jgi:small subunit ribosomal protein S20
VANHKSALKQYRQSVKRRTRNRANRSRMRSAVKRLRQLILSDAVAARSALPTTLGLIDHTAKLGAIHDNAAARTKSRLTRAVNNAG